MNTLYCSEAYVDLHHTLSWTLLISLKLPEERHHKASLDTDRPVTAADAINACYT